MANARFNASLFRAVLSVATHIEGRPYFSGGLIQACSAGGVLMVATDGHRMLVALDSDGETDADVVVGLAGRTPRLSKPDEEEGPRIGSLSGRELTIKSANGDKLVTDASAVIDCAYPDWRRALPVGPLTVNPGAVFSSGYLRDMAKAGQRFAKALGQIHLGYGPAMTFAQASDKAPALIRWNAINNAFGVLMPMNVPVASASANIVPGFALASVPAQAA